ncbi:hypothetical protein HP456_05920 [Bacillus haikouensis]|jgi:hypothetical protein|uniref:hypothetical protein n=1 Tax=Bacillus haikouensis TaxID=1510468 RepID=UPI0015573DC0|nr:hypothetical protein [Bacillus haikouensis]NQD65455.1 hypothetical protein [Bacillus haikouensis]
MNRYHPFYHPVQSPYQPHHSRRNYQLYPSFHYRNNFPQVETKTFMASADKTLTLMESAHLVLMKIKNDTSFANQLMNLAQQSNTPEVLQLIRRTGVKVVPAVSFNPDGIHMVFDEKLGEVDCCHIIVNVRWREM